MLARELGLLYIDTGSMYRAVALAVIESTMNAHDDVAVGDLAERIEIDLGGDPNALRVFLDSRDVSARIRDEDVTQISSIVSTIPAVRRAMVERQRNGKAWRGEQPRHQRGFPNADIKFYRTPLSKKEQNGAS
jgi:cytidylate kinase